MKKMTYMGVSVGLVASLVLGACGGGEDEPKDVTPGDGDGDDVVGDGDGDDPVGDGDGDMGGAPGDGDGDGDCVSNFVTDGLGESGDWRGYLFTAAETGSSITPEEFTGNELHVSGTLGADYEEWAMVGFNIAQEIDEETFMGGDVNAIAPGGSGIEVNINNIAGSGLRIQIQTDDTGTESYCADVPTGGVGVIPWESFTQECWPGGAMAPAYDPSTEIAQIAVQAYAQSDMVPTNFEYCVIDLKAAP